MKQKLAQLLRRVIDDNDLNQFPIHPDLREEIQEALREYDTLAFLDLEIDKTKSSLYRNCDLKKEDVFRSVFRLELAAGIDMSYYAQKVERWSDKNEGKKRKFNGWKATVLDFADGDKRKNQLVMIQSNQPDEFDRMFNQ